MRTRSASPFAAARGTSLLPHPGAAGAGPGRSPARSPRQRKAPWKACWSAPRRTAAPSPITVVSDAQGHFSFPASKLEPGKYAISIRAIGYDLDGPKSVELAAGKPATADVKLAKTKNLAQQMSNGEWIMSVPGTQQQKLSLLNCVSCHTLERIVKSSYDKDGFADADPAAHGQLRQPEHADPSAEARRDAAAGRTRRRACARARAKQAEFLSSINLSEATAWEYRPQDQSAPEGPRHQGHLSPNTICRARRPSRMT